MKPKNIALCGLFIGAALIMYIIENQIPLPFVVPSFKLGFSNIITLVTLYLWDKKHSFIILILRIVLASVICGGGVTILYSAAGGIASFAGDCILKRFAGRSVEAVSAGAAVFHNAGQLAAAAFILKSTSVFVYFPVLSALGVVSGTVTGAVGAIIIKNKYIKSLFRDI